MIGQRAAGAGPAAAKAQNSVEIGFVARCLTDGATWRSSRVQEGTTNTRPIRAENHGLHHRPAGVRETDEETTRREINCCNNTHALVKDHTLHSYKELSCQHLHPAPSHHP